MRIFLWVFVIGTLVITGCIEDKSVLRAGYANEPPFAQALEDGKVVGLFPETLNTLAKELGYERMEWVLMPFGNLISALGEKRIDVIATGMTVTAKRAEQVCFAQPLASAPTAYLWLAEGSLYNPSISVRRQSLVFAVLAGSVEEAWLREQLPPGALMAVEDPHIGLLAVKHKKADILVLTRPSLEQLIASELGNSQSPALQYKKNGHDIRQIQGYVIGGIKGLLQQQQQQLAFGFRQASEAQLLKWNQAQQKLQQQPEFQQTLARLGLKNVNLEGESLQHCFADG